MKGELQGKTVLIAGASGALGSAVTRQFADSAAALVLVARSRERLERLTAEIGLAEERTLVFPCDVTQESQVQDLLHATMDRFGHIDVLLNVTGGWSGGQSIAEMPIEMWDVALALNLRAAFLLSRAVLPSMLANGWGRIVHVSSRAALEPRTKQGAYAVAKMGLITLTDVIAAEVKGTGITANVIVPAIIDTLANREAMPRGDPSKWVPPEHIAAVMFFLCTEAAATINGAHITMYGAL